MARAIHLLHDARNLARIVGVETPCCASVAMSTEGPATVFAAFVDGNPLADGWLVDLDAPGARLVAWSGTLADGLFDDDPRTWMRAGQERFARFLDEVAPALRQHGRTLCFRPHHRHVVGDVHAAVRLLRERAGGPFEVLLAPADLLATSMLRDVEDHLARAFAHLGPVAAAVLLEDVRRPATGAGDDARLETVPFGDGELPHAVVARLLAEHVPETTPVVSTTGDLARLRDLLGMAVPRVAS